MAVDDLRFSNEVAPVGLAHALLELVDVSSTQGAALAIAFVAAFIISIAFHSVVAAVIVLLSAITVSYVVGIAWMRTTTHRVRDRQNSLP